MVITGIALWIGWSWWVLSDSEAYRDIFPVPEFGAEAGWQAIEGQARMTSEGFEVFRPGTRGRVFISLELLQPLRARDFRAIEVSVSGASQVPIYPIWSSSDVYLGTGAPIEWRSVSEGRVSMDTNPEWRGDIFFIGLEQLGLDSPWALHNIRFIPIQLDFWSLQRRVLERMWVKGAWGHGAINFTYPAGYGLSISPVLGLMIWVLISTLVFIFLSKERSFKMLPLLLVPWLMVWLILDLRWQVELLDKARHTWDVFGSVPAEDRSLHEFDGEIVQFLREFRALSDELTVNRIFVVSDTADLRMRARYHLADLNARAVATPVAVSTLPDHLQPDDVVMVLNARKVRMQERPSSSNQVKATWASMTQRGQSVMSGPLIMKSGELWVFKPQQER